MPIQSEKKKKRKNGHRSLDSTAVESEGSGDAFEESVEKERIKRNKKSKNSNDNGLGIVSYAPKPGEQTIQECIQLSYAIGNRVCSSTDALSNADLSNLIMNTECTIIAYTNAPSRITGPYLVVKWDGGDMVVKESCSSYGAKDISLKYTIHNKNESK